MSERGAKKEQETAPDKAARITASATRWIAIFTLVSVLVNAGMFLVLRRQLREMHDSGVDTHTLAGATKVSADAAKKAAGIADDTLNSSKESFRIEQRPYVVAQIPQFVTGAFTPDRLIEANVTFKDVGKTPALKIVVNIAFRRFDGDRGQAGREKLTNFLTSSFNTLALRDEKGRKEIERLGIGRDLAPNDSTFSTNPGTGADSLIVPSKDFPKIAAEKIALFYLGIISYQDSSQNYRTEFCYFFIGTQPQIWHVCDSHNTIQ